MKTLLEVKKTFTQFVNGAGRPA